MNSLVNFLFNSEFSRNIYYARSCSVFATLNYAIKIIWVTF